MNDNLQRVLKRHDDMAKGNPITEGIGVTETSVSVSPLMNVNHEDDESDEDDFSQLSLRSHSIPFTLIVANFIFWCLLTKLTFSFLVILSKLKSTALAILAIS